MMTTARPIARSSPAVVAASWPKFRENEFFECDERAVRTTVVDEDEFERCRGAIQNRSQSFINGPNVSLFIEAGDHNGYFHAS
jgi:hypothetical protein